MAVAISAAAHVGVGVLILGARGEPQALTAPPGEPVIVTLFQPPPPRPAPAPDPVEEPSEAAAAPAGPPPPDPPAGPVRPEPPRQAPAPRPRPVTPRPSAETVALNSRAEGPQYTVIGAGAVAGARSSGAGGTGGGGGPGGSGSGRGGGDCDMLERLERALRDDPEVRAAAAAAHGEAGAGQGAVLVWNGDWIRAGVQEGKGLAGVRQAIAVEVAFAPRACQAERVRGLAVLRLTSAADGPKVALGRGDWAWGDLVERRR